MVDPVVGLRPDAELFDVVEIDGGGVALVGQVFQVADDLVRRREGQAVAQGFGDREEVEPGAILLGAEEAVQFVSGFAGAEEMVVVDGHVGDAGFGQRRHHGRFPDALGEPGAGRCDAGPRGQFVVQRAQLADPVAVGNGGEHRFGVTGTEQLDLAARDHFGEQRHVSRMAFAQPVEQPARKMGGEAEVRVGVKRFDERLVTALVRVLDHFREIAHRLVGVDAEEQGYELGHILVCSSGRAGSGIPWVFNWRGAWCRCFPAIRHRR